MKKIRTLFRIMLVMIFGVFVSISAEEARLEIVAVGTTHAAGEPITLQITYVNPAERPLGLVSKNGPEIVDEFDFNFTIPGDKAPAKTAYFQDLINEKKNRISDNSSVIINEVEASKSLKREILISLYYDCTSEGEYAGRLTTTNVKDSDGKPILLTGTFRFKIGPPR